MASDYEKQKKEYTAIFQLHKENNSWIRVHTATGAIYGKFLKSGENIVYLMPSLVFEERKNREGFNLEERLPTTISFPSIQGTQPISKECIDFLISKGNDPTKTGFNNKV